MNFVHLSHDRVTFDIDRNISISPVCLFLKLFHVDVSYNCGNMASHSCSVFRFASYICYCLFLRLFHVDVSYNHINRATHSCSVLLFINQPVVFQFIVLGFVHHCKLSILSYSLTERNFSVSAKQPKYGWIHTDSFLKNGTSTHHNCKSTKKSS